MFSKYMQMGGPLMWPLALCSFLLIAILVERFWQIGVKAVLLRRKLTERSLTWHRRPLLFFTDVPPSIGLLGTVLGVVQSFNITSGRLSGDAIGAGLGVACLTTIFGLGIAIAASIANHLLETLIVDRVEAASQGSAKK